jgi:hypothetical protein
LADGTSFENSRQGWGKMTTATDKDFVHPADALALALDRAAGLLAVLGDLYNPTQDSFASGNGFVMHGMNTASTLLSDARSALLDLHEGCDLVLKDDTQISVGLQPEAETEEPVVAFSRATAEPSWVAAENTALHSNVEPKPSSSDQEHFAKTYLDLLKKLTAAEIFASEQQALAAPGTGTDLLPLLRGLREDFQKMHRAG